MYKVLNKEGNIIKVESIDVNLHRHLSGREFNENDTCLMVNELIDNDSLKIIKKNSPEEREEAVKAYKEKYGKAPSHLMKTENIIAKL
jgi:hypothetical protein